MQSLRRNTALVPFSSCPRSGSHTPLPVFGSGSPLHWPGLMAAVLPKQARSLLQELWPIFPLLPSQAMTANDIYRLSSHAFSLLSVVIDRPFWGWNA